MSHSARSNEVEELQSVENVKDVEQRSVNSCYGILRYGHLVNAFKRKFDENGENGACQNFLDLVDQRDQNLMEVSSRIKGMRLGK
jgi:hypothetical protein